MYKAINKQLYSKFSAFDIQNNDSKSQFSETNLLLSYFITLFTQVCS